LSACGECAERQGKCSKEDGKSVILLFGLGIVFSRIKTKKPEFPDYAENTESS